MAIQFDTGPKGTFRDLCNTYPDETAYASGFRTKWGPIFYRGRADGTARVLAIGQDPAQHEAVVRRILIGEAGRRVQGFLAKLGFTKRYILVNAFLYGIFNQSMAVPHLLDPAIAAYRHKWFDAILAPGKIEAVIAFGTPAHNAWTHYRTTPSGTGFTGAYHHVMHPTAAGHGSPVITIANQLANWNTGLTTLHPLITHPDVATPLVLYGSNFTAADLPPIPSIDAPFGIPDWMREEFGWAVMASTPGNQRANYTVTVPTV
jgi:uracil-DNA glycosylase